MTIVWLMVGIIVIFLAVILVRAAMFRPLPEPEIKAEEVVLNEEKIVADMADMIRCKTVSYREEEKIDREEFEGLFA